MKIIISESQHKRLFEEEQKVLNIPSVKLFGGWEGLQGYLESKGNPFYSVDDTLYLQYKTIDSFESLISVGGDLDLRNNQTINSLGTLTSVGGSLDLLDSTITSLGNLTSVGGYLDLGNTTIKSLGNLTYVGEDLELQNTPISEKYSEEEIRQMVNVRGDIYL